MPMFRNAFEPQLKSQQFAIELLMRKKQHEEDISLKNKAIEVEKLKIQDEKLKGEAEIKRKAAEGKIKFMQNMYGEAVKSSNPELAEKFGKPLDALGYPVAAEPTGMDSGSEPAPLRWLVNKKKPATSLEQLIASDPNMTLARKIELKKSLKEDTPSALKKLIEERSLLPENDPKREIYDQAITKSATSKGMTIESDGKGGFTIKTGVNTNTPSGLQKPTVTKIEEKQFAANEGLSRISNIVRSFKPEFQEIPTKLGVAWSSLKSKLGANIPPEEKTKLEEFGRFKQDSLENINLYIKEITGAQMSEKEADRIRRAQPDPGDGVFGGDDPITFKSKLINQYKKLRMAAVRQGFYLSQGLGDKALKQLIKNDDVISLERMEKILDERGEKYAAEIKKQNPNISTSDLFSQVKDRLKKEFNVEF